MSLETGFLYHATYKKNLSSIEKEGIRAFDHSLNWSGFGEKYWSGEPMIFLAFDPITARRYAEDADNASKDDTNNIVILQVDPTKLDEKKIGYDYNNHCETEDAIDSCVYEGDIPTDAIKEFNPSLVGSIQKVSDLLDRVIDEWYDKVAGYYLDEE